MDEKQSELKMIFATGHFGCITVSRLPWLCKGVDL